MSVRLLLILAVLALVAGLIVGQLLRRQLDDAKADGGVVARLRKRLRRFLLDFALGRNGKGKDKDKGRDKSDG